MKRNLTPIASGVALFLMSAALSVQAQEADSNNVQTVVTTGIRASLQQALNVKRREVTNVEVVTAEDVGKMPDHNVADSLQRLPGVNIETSAAGSGGFDENDRVSLRGTAPSLTQTLINGHPVSSGDWFALDQGGGAVGRSVSFSLFPSEMIGQVIVHKDAKASDVEGGSAGSVDILTRAPLDFKKNLSIEATAEAVYASLPGKTDPQYNALINWRNDSKTFGVMVQGFDEKRSLRRDGQELLNWSQITVGGQQAYYPTLIGSTEFEQTRIRKGGLIDVEIKPTNDLSLDASYFYSKLNATNYNRNFMFWGANAGAPDAGSTTIQNGTLTSAKWTTAQNAACETNGVNATTGLPDNSRTCKDYAIVDEIYRPDERATTQFFNLDAKWRATDQLTFSVKAGETKGVGETPSQDVFEGQQGGVPGATTGYSYQLNGLNAPATASFIGFDPSSFTGNPAIPGSAALLNWVFGESITMTDKEKYGQIDGEYALDSGIFSSLNFGVRATKHDRYNFVINQGPNFGNTNTGLASVSTNPAWNGTTYPSDFGQDLGGSFPTNVWQLDPSILQAWGDAHSNRSISREYFTDMFNVDEKTQAAYVSTDLAGDGWSGNAGVRFVRTKDNSLQYQILPTSGGVLPSFLFGGFLNAVQVENDNNDVLPSASLKIKAAKDVDALFSISRTLTRPDYGALAGTLSIGTDPLTADGTGNGNGGNPFLKPITSNNYDASLQWYYAPRGLLSAGVFHMDMHNYVGYQSSTQSLLNSTLSQKAGTGVFSNYVITSPIGVDASVTGLEFAAQVPLSAGWGVDGNLTVADSSEAFGGCKAFETIAPSSPCDVVGASKLTYNADAYYENDTFNARVGWAWRSDYLAAYDRGTPLYQAASGTLSASANYNVTDNLTITFSGANLNKPILRNYVFNKDQPARFYSNGAQYYLGVRVKY